MEDDEEPVTERDEQVEASDALDAYLPGGLAEIGLPPPGELNSTAAAKCLTEADRQALSAMARPLALANEIVMEAKAAYESVPRQDKSTVALDRAYASTAATRPRENSGGFGDANLMRSLYAFERETLINWQSRYRKVRELGRGGQGVVYLCECLDEFGPMALKAFSPEPYGNSRLYDEEMDRMDHVASQVHRINSENVLDVDRLAGFGGIRVMVMRWVDGYDLQRLLHRGCLERITPKVNKDRWDRLNDAVVTFGPEHLRLQPGVAVNIIQDCLQGLDALHRRGIVHGDIKPSNIMLNTFGTAKLIDLGSAFELQSRPKQHTWTPQYAAPEVLESKLAREHGRFPDVVESRQWSTRSDLASLGYVLIELLAGRPAILIPNVDENSTRTTDVGIDDTTLKAMLDAKRSLPDRLPKLLRPEFKKAERLMRLCQGLIHPDPKQRFPDAHEAIEGRQGTVNYGFDLANSNLGAAFRREIQRWIEDVKKTDE